MPAFPLPSAFRPSTVTLAKAAVFLVSLRVLGFAIYGNNNEQQLPLVQVTNDPSLYPGDPFVGSLEYYASCLWRVLWLPFRFIPEQPLLVALTLLQRLFFLFAAGRLARAFADGSRAAELAAWCFFAFGLVPFLGWGTVLPRGFEHTSLAVASFLLCLAFLVEGRLVRAGVCLGLVGLANIIHGLQALLLLVPAFVLHPGLRRQPRLARAGLVTLALMLPAIVLAIRTAAQPTIVAGAFLRLLRFYVPQHWFPSTWAAREWIAFGLAGGCVLAFCRWPVLPAPVRRMVLGLTVGHLVLLLAAAAAERSGRPDLLGLQLARSSDLWTPVSAIFVLAALVRKLEADPKLSTQLACALGLAGVLMLWVQRSFLGWFAVLSIAFGLLAVWLARSHRPRMARVAPLVVPVLSLAVFLTLASTRVRPDKALFQDRSVAELELTQWARAHTRVDASFLVDPGWSAFRMLSRRNIFVTWKEGAGFLWYQPFADAWIERFRALGVDPFNPRLSYPESLQAASLAFARLDDSAALRLARDFGLHYWIVPRRKTSALPTVFQNKMAKILALR